MGRLFIIVFLNFSLYRSPETPKSFLLHWEGMADTRSKHGRKGVEQVVEEEIVVPVLEDASPVGFQTLVRYLLENNKCSDRTRRQEAEDAERRQEEREIRRREVEQEAEKRRRQDIIDAEERQEKRDAKKLLLEKEAREELRKQQIEDEKRAFEHQQELMKLQAEIGEKADTVRRVESDRSRKRDRAVAAIQSYRESDDVEDYLLTAEKKLQVGEIPEGEWATILASKLGGKIGSAWQDLLMAGGEYKDVKAGLLTVCGYTPKLAGELFFGFRQDALKGMSADQLWHRGVQLLRRIVAPARLEPGVEFALVKAWIWSVVPRKARVLLDARVVSTSGELIGALQDHLVLEGDRSEGQVAVFRRQNQGQEFGRNIGSVGANGRRVAGNCFKCGKPGHKAADCWQEDTSGGSSGASEPSSSDSGFVRTIVCYTCGVEGHKSTQCPKIKQENPSPKVGQAKPVRRLRHEGATDVVIKGVVNGKEVSIVLDSGTVISVVPEYMVGEEQKTGEVVSIIAFQSKEPVYFPIARVKFKIEHLEWEEEVALAPVVEGQSTEVLCRLDVRSDLGFQLVALVREQDKILREVTRSEAKEEASEQKNIEKVIAVEKPKKKPVTPAVEEAVETGKGGLAADRPVSTPKAADRPVSTPKPGPAAAVEPNIYSVVEGKESSLAEDEDGAIDLLVEDEDCVVELLAEDEAEDEEEDLIEDKLSCLKPRGSKENDLVISPGKSEKGSRADLVEEPKTDLSVEGRRTLAEGDLIVSRRPDRKEAWQGPHNLVKAVSRVENEAKLEKGGSKVVYYPRMEEDRRIMGVENGREDKMLEPNIDKRVVGSSRRKIGFDGRKVGWDGRIVGCDRGEGLAVSENRAAANTSVLSPRIAKPAPSAVDWTEEGLETFKDSEVSPVKLSILTISSEEDVFVFHDGESAVLERKELEYAAETTGLRAAPISQLVGGDVGTSPTDKKEESVKGEEPAEEKVAVCKRKELEEAKERNKKDERLKP